MAEMRLTVFPALSVEFREQISLFASETDV